MKDEQARNETSPPNPQRNKVTACLFNAIIGCSAQRVVAQLLFRASFSEGKTSLMMIGRLS